MITRSSLSTVRTEAELGSNRNSHPSAFEQSRIVSVVASNGLDLLIVVSALQHGQTVGIELPAPRVQLSPVLLGQLGLERVDGDDERAPVGLERQYLAHDLGRGAAEVLAKVVEGLEVGLVQRVADDLDVHLVEVLLGDAVDEERGERRVDEDSVVELGRGRGDVDGLHLLEAAQRVALWDQLGDGALVQRARDQQDDVVYHVAAQDKEYVININIEGPRSRTRARTCFIFFSRFIWNAESRNRRRE